MNAFLFIRFNPAGKSIFATTSYNALQIDLDQSRRDDVIVATDFNTLQIEVV